MKFVVGTKQETQDYQDKTFAIELRALSVDGKLIRDSDKKVVRITSLTDAQLNNGYVIYGFNSGVRQLNEGKTTAWDIPKQRKDGKWIVEFSPLVPSPTEEFKDTWFAKA